MARQEQVVSIACESREDMDAGTLARVDEAFGNFELGHRHSSPITTPNCAFTTAVFLFSPILPQFHRRRRGPTASLALSCGAGERPAIGPYNRVRIPPPTTLKRPKHPYSLSARSDGVNCYNPEAIPSVAVPRHREMLPFSASRVDTNSESVHY